MPAGDGRLKQAYLALVALALIWGYTWIVVGVAGRDASPFFIAAVRAAVGAAVLFALLVVLRKPLRPTPIRDTAIFGLLQTTGWIGLQTVAVVLGGAGKTALLAYTMPFWIVLLAWPFLGERLSALRWTALALAGAGLICIVLPLRSGALAADACAVGAGLAWGAATVWSKRMQREGGGEFDVLRLTAWQMVWGGIPLVLLALAIPEHVRWTTSLVLAMAFLTTIAQAVAWVLWLFIVSRLPAGVAGIASLATPVLAVLFAALQLHEIPSPQELAGAGLLAAALAVNVRG